MKKPLGIFGLLAILAMTVIATAQENPVEGYITGKIIPFAQSILTMIGILYMIFGAGRLMKSDDPAEADKGKKQIIGVAIAIAVIWLAPAIVNWLKPA